ncbi:hypothetical protein [Neoroseomonas lacus]|uniref:Uncharacterized protein n=1 Tax=Neoroseomonas lacus TaxID=287609 RepID=A0A917L404_9PROT|nr:hypothetical protein [Neoroseomonas lacus]GGJ41948.1 hypothetical protein GCM10011320_56910 [Neoroseomonas lacus]
MSSFRDQVGGRAVEVAQHGQDAGSLGIGQPAEHRLRLLPDRHRADLAEHGEMLGKGRLGEAAASANAPTVISPSPTRGQSRRRRFAFGIERSADLADHREIKRGVQAARNLDRDRHTAARQRIDRQLLPGLGPMHECRFTAIHIGRPSCRAVDTLISSKE